MPYIRGTNTKSIPLQIVGSSVFGRHPKIDAQYTYNMFISQDALVNYPGYKAGIRSSLFGNATTGRGIFNSPKLNRIVAVFDNRVYLIDLDFDQHENKIIRHEISLIGTIGTISGNVFISENNKPQIVISDGTSIYVYDPQATLFTGEVISADAGTDVITYTGERQLISGEKVVFSGGSLPAGIVAGVTYYVTNGVLTDTTFQISTTPTEAYLAVAVDITGTGTGTFVTRGTFQQVFTTFRPGFIDFHDTYILCAASNDTFFDPSANNSYRLSAQNNAFIFPDDSSSIGLLETKPDRTQAVVRAPSGGNMIFVMGKTVTETWFDTGAQLFPYQRNNQQNMDYGCLNPDTVATINNTLVWLAFNERSGPVIMFTTGGTPERISTDGIDFFMSQLQSPEDSEAFIYRQDGHTFYHLNFYTDNWSIVYDFETQKFFNVSDQDMKSYRMDKMAFFNNQYFAVTRQDGNFYIYDTTIHTYENPNQDGDLQTYVVPRIRTPQHIRLPSQNYFILNDIGFTVETGETNYLVQAVPAGDAIPWTFISETGDTFVSESGLDVFVTEAVDPSTETIEYRQTPPRIDLSVSYDGGATYGASWAYELPTIGQRRNRVMWWQGGLTNDTVVQVRFVSIGRVVALDGEANIRA